MNFEDVLRSKNYTHLNTAPRVSFKFFGPRGVKIEVYAWTRAQAWRVLKSTVRPDLVGGFSLDKVEVPTSYWEDAVNE